MIATLCGPVTQRCPRPNAARCLAAGVLTAGEWHRHAPLPSTLGEKALWCLARSHRGLEPIRALADATPDVSLFLPELHGLLRSLCRCAFALPFRRLACGCGHGLACLARRFAKAQVNRRQTKVGNGVLHLGDDLCDVRPRTRFGSDWLENLACSQKN